MIKVNMNTDFLKNFKECPICKQNDIHVPIDMQSGHLLFETETENNLQALQKLHVHFVKCNNCGYIMLFSDNKA